MGNYDKARAQKMKSSSGWSYSTDGVSKKTKNKVKKSLKKSPLLIIIAIAFIFGAVGGFFAFKYTSSFQMNDYFVNGTRSVEVDYVTVEVSEHKDLTLQECEQSGTAFSMDLVYSTLDLVDKGATAKFFGMDVSNTIKIRVLYREDITFDPVVVEKIDVAKPGVYYIEYTSTHFAFKNTSLIRTVVVKGVEVDG